MANILLIDPPWYALQNIFYTRVSYGLASLAAVLKNNGHNCVIYDGEFQILKPPYSNEGIFIDFDLYCSNLNDNSLIWRKTWENIKRIIINFNPLIIGVTIPTAKYLIAVKITSRIKKEFPHITIVVGGPHPTIQPLGIIREPSIDIVVKGEGEHSFLELVSAIENEKEIKNIAGITFKLNSNILDNPVREYIGEIDELPFPAWELTYKYAEHHPDSFGTVFTARGCPFRCIYCASHKIWSRKVRYMSSERVVNELEYTSEKYGTNFFRFNDDTFLLDQERVTEICEEIKRRNLKIKWMCEIRADLCILEILNVMKSAGCVRVNLGIESGNPEILKYIEKGITLAQIYRAVSAIKRAKLELMAYFMVGFPNETISQIRDTIKVMDKIRPDYPCWSVVTPYSGTKLNEIITQQQLLPPKLNWSYFFHHSPAMPISKKIDSDTFRKLIQGIEKRKQRMLIQISRNRRIKETFCLLLFHPVEFVNKTYVKVLRLLNKKNPL